MTNTSVYHCILLLFLILWFAVYLVKTLVAIISFYHCCSFCHVLLVIILDFVLNASSNICWGIRWRNVLSSYGTMSTL